MADRRLSSASSSGNLQVPPSPEPRSRRESFGSTASTVRSPGHQRRGSSPGPGARPDYLRHSRISSGGGSRDSVMSFTSTQTTNVLRPKKWKPFFLEPLAGLATIGVLIAVAVVLEFMLKHSNDNQGFSAGPLNRFAATQFVKSFVPPVIAIPLLFLIRKGNSQLRLVTPYSDLAKGSASPKVLMTNYAQSSTAGVMFRATLNGHFLLVISGISVAVAALIQPLAGSLFTVKSSPVNFSGLSTTGLMTVGLNPQAATLAPFVAAAGFVAAAVSNNLTDPPLIHGGWTIPPYQTNELLKSFDNATLTLNSPAIQSAVQCVPGKVDLAANTTGNDNDTVSFTASLGGATTSGTNSSCTFTIPIDTPTLNWQAGAQTVDPSCNQYITSGSKAGMSDPNLDLDFRSVAFWIYSFGDEAGAAVFCTPLITAYNVLVESNVTDNSIRNVSVTGQYAIGNNVTGSPVNGRAYNGIEFSNAGNDKFTQARATVAPLTLADAILSKGKQLNGGLSSMIKNQTSTVTTVAQIYTQFLAVAAAQTYFVPAQNSLQSTLSIYTFRLWLDPLATHALAGLCAAIALIIAVVYTLDWRKRRNLFIASEPGSIAASAAVLSQSKFARTLIRANQTPDEIEKTLRGMKFGFDMRTWAIEAEGYNGEDYLFYAKGEGMTPRADDEDMEERGLLAAQQMEMTPYVSAYPNSPGRDPNQPLHADLSPSPSPGPEEASGSGSRS